MIEKIQGQDIRKQYNPGFGLDCSLNVSKGPLYTIVGPNGSGKSSLLRILSLNESPDSGRVIYHNQGEPLINPFRDIRARRRIVLVTTRSRVFNDTVYNNVAYGLKLRNLKRADVRDRVINALNDVKLNGKEDMNATRLSSGEAQRLALARAFAINPDILFLDEPTVSLDPDNIRLTEEIIAEWRRRSDKITVMVTHSLPQAKALSDYVIFMHKGSILEISGSNEFFKKPATEMAQKFVFGEVY